MCDPNFDVGMESRECDGVLRGGGGCRVGNVVRVLGDVDIRCSMG